MQISGAQSSPGCYMQTLCPFSYLLAGTTPQHFQDPLPSSAVSTVFCQLPKAKPLICSLRPLACSWWERSSEGLGAAVRPVHQSWVPKLCDLKGITYHESQCPHL